MRNQCETRNAAGMTARFGALCDDGITARYPVRTAESVSDWQKRRDLGTYSYAADVAAMRDAGGLDVIDFDYIKNNGAAMVGDPARCIEIGER